MANFYQLLKSAGSSNFEIVFVSSDRDEHSFDEYFAEMPWASLPYSDRASKERLSSKFGVQGIPTLVVLGPDGELITKNGRSKVSEDPTGAQFPWFPTTFAEDFGTLFEGKSGVVNASSFGEKVPICCGLYLFFIMISSYANEVISFLNFVYLY